MVVVTPGVVIHNEAVRMDSYTGSPLYTPRSKIGCVSELRRAGWFLPARVGCCRSLRAVAFSERYTYHAVARAS
ncbi:hypothetical protein AYI70_g4798 [Smittium culicis]|uniref:Uncharacterized protein n=1 Tax=Smittium culicis TaxID=133412 RepID=A0A1R1XXU1_9FUNG|nr:hypothetical protein AYI70_g4798 [Smittium culicis]